MNAADGVLNFSKDLMELTGISKTGSIVTLWVQEPAYSNSNGSLDYGGVVLNPGYNGTSGTILTATFRVKGAGTGAVSFSSASVLANDGLGTNILSSSSGGSYSFISKKAATPSPVAKTPTPAPKLAPAVFSSTHPDQNKWYRNNNPVVGWSVPADVKEVRIDLDKTSTVPQAGYPPTTAEKSFVGVNDGVWYVNVQFIMPTGPGPASSFKL
ncbi:MAG: Uncharacterized protein CEN90_709 [Parcubacteria group bacterium Licking1014_17]|nr:MAG: Uncharacterized protein CEN90_709 [Parcubacteria group bacterium Licking1014_17]